MATEQGNPKDGESKEAPRGESEDKSVDQVVEEMVTSLGQPSEAQGMEMTLGILNEMEQQNEGIKELFRLLESKVFTDNQKERLTWGKLDEAKGLLKNISTAITALSTAIEETMTTVAEKSSDHLNDQTENVKGHCELMKLQSENSNMI
ncbi:hypothetical protein Dimus_013316 [Dionaea muscipula]